MEEFLETSREKKPEAISGLISNWIPGESLGNAVQEKREILREIPGEFREEFGSKNCEESLEVFQ